MSQRIRPAATMFLLAGLCFSGPSWPLKQDPSLPAELVWLTLLTDEVHKNPRGFWEAKLMKGTVMVHIPAGEFTMGSPDGEPGREPDEGPLHSVFVKDIMIGRSEVTRGIWNAVMGGRPPAPEERDLPQGDVSYQDIQSFLRKLNAESGLDFRLPTEAEWEKCCRGGNWSPRYGPLEEIAWYARNSDGKAHPVGTKKPNGYGLFDMLGNAWEWCSDWFGKTYYGTSPSTDPVGPGGGARRVCRGGGYLHGETYLRSAHRNSQDPAKHKPYLGFRLVLDSPLKPVRTEMGRAVELGGGAPNFLGIIAAALAGANFVGECRGAR